MKNIFILPSFERSLKKMSLEQKDKIKESLEVFNSFILGEHLPVRFGWKKINHDKYEFRANIKLRIVVKIDNNEFFLVLVGNHDQIRQYLRNFRNK